MCSRACIERDRLVLSLINRKQLRPKDFAERPGGAAHLDESGRKAVLVAYQKRKQEEVAHAVLGSRFLWASCLTSRPGTSPGTCAATPTSMYPFTSR